MGVGNYPKIDWVRIMSWSNAEDLKVELRDQIMDVGYANKRDEIMTAIRMTVDGKFTHRHMDDFKYLLAENQPGTATTIILFVLGVLVCGGLGCYFYINDPFDSGYDRWGSRY